MVAVGVVEDVGVEVELGSLCERGGRVVLIVGGGG